MSALRHPLALPSLAVALAACSSLPARHDTRTLYVDLRKSIELSEDTGWVVDRLELQENLESALRSVCQVDPAISAALATHLTEAIEAEGGPAKLQYLEDGVDYGDLDEVLTLERTAGLLRLAESRRERDCPFWLEPKASFDGVEGDTDKTVVLLESQGFGAILIRGDDQDLSGGGGARVLLGRGVTSRLTLAVGGEFGGSGTLNPADTEGRLDTSLHVAVPVMLRWFDISRVFDLELAPVVRFDEAGVSSLPPGVRASFGYGLTTMRQGAFMPYVVVWLGYEGHGLFNDDKTSHSLRVGTRVGFDWDPGS